MRRPDVIRILAGLKDFQRDTVEHVFRRMYLDNDHVRRFLLADEVGLGKTLVTRGVAALAVDHLWDTEERIDIVYICSNNDIARQNVNRLRFSDEDEFTLATRLTLLPVQIGSLKAQRVNFVSFTPGTSFDLQSRMGVAEERVLLYRLLSPLWDLKGASSIEIFRGDVDASRFRRLVRNHTTDINEQIAGDFGAAVELEAELLDRYAELVGAITANKNRLTEATAAGRRELIADLRAALCEKALEALEPDLIILDEFQRFKHLLTEGDDASRLARRLFNYSNSRTKARLLLVSATPYRMYSVADEADGDEHYRDFIATVEFLAEDATRAAACRSALGDYRQALLRLPEDGSAAVARATSALSTELRRVMVRTERLAADTDRAGMLEEVPCPEMCLTAEDALDFVYLERLAEKLNEPGTLEYWKSAPYVLSFMDQYKLKRVALEALEDGGDSEGQMADVLQHRPQLSLQWRGVQRYEPISPQSPRLRWLAQETVGRGAWQLLWMPPSRPSYRLAGAYGNPRLQGFTKRLVFSSWHVVPKAVAALLSYDAERRIMTVAEPAAENTPEARRKRRALLKFARTSEREVTAMPSMALFYPSFALAKLGDHLDGKGLPNEWTAETWHAEVVSRIEAVLQQLPVQAARTGQEDDRWYWVAPLFLDLAVDAPATRAWLSKVELASAWAGALEDDRDEGEADESSDVGWRAHVEELKKGSETKRLGRQPADLAGVLARVAIAGPGVAALRALSRIAGGRNALFSADLRMNAAQLGFGFRSLFNSPEAMALLRSDNSQVPYWKLVLQHALEGDLSAVLEEYVHVLRESLGHGSRNRFAAAADVAAHIGHVLAMRTSTLDVDTLTVSNGRRVKVGRHKMRTRFAMRFGEQGADEVEAARREGRKLDRTRATHVRDAFNSPFWPFVLVSTSVGQEGLDFHQYCHAVVHWNLPNNPVDLEQREGRVHRYKGHAIRKNVARAFADTLVAGERELADPWEVMFREARKVNEHGSELVPYWVLRTQGGARIERYVPALPLSRDRAKHQALVRALAIYRMAFGQSRQEDMIQYLLRTMPTDQLKSAMMQAQIDLSPPRASVSREECTPDESIWMPSKPAAEGEGGARSRVIPRPAAEQRESVRRDWHAAKQVFEAAIPDVAKRQSVLALLAESIRTANEVTRKGWGITLFPGFDVYVRLNVSRIEVFVLKSSEEYRVKLVVKPSTLDKTVRETLYHRQSADGTWMEQGVVYSSQPSARPVRVTDAGIIEWLPVLTDAHQAMVREAASRAQGRSMWWAQHSPAVIEYLRKEGIEVPDPSY